MAEYLHVPAIDFRPQYYYPTAGHSMPRDVVMPHYLGGDWIRFVLAPQPQFPAKIKLDANVRVPNGARIITFDTYLKDDDTADIGAASSATLKRRNPARSAGAAILATVPLSTGGKPGYVTKSGTVRRNAAFVNTEKYFYYIEVVIALHRKPTWFGLQFRGCRVGYEP